MSIQDEYERNKNLSDYVQAKTRMVSLLDSVISMLNAAVAFKTKYPSDATEVDQNIGFVKTKCQNIIDSY